MVNEFDIGKKCIELWGESDQIRQTVEECAELITVLAKYGRNVNGSTKEEICEEIADVEIMINQMKIVFDNSLIDSYKQMKLARLNKRVYSESLRRNINMNKTKPFDFNVPVPTYRPSENQQIIQLLKMINNNIIELKKTLDDFLYHYHQYEGKKK